MTKTIEKPTLDFWEQEITPNFTEKIQDYFVLCPNDMKQEDVQHLICLAYKEGITDGLLFAMWLNE
ncbi:MAG: hypothetical protein GX663_02780 [Clostridiales bacterium]|nr:hypothetical protein [Clostridiales bacterium]